jgi:hemoglobin-like flavoprotein
MYIFILAVITKRDNVQRFKPTIITNLLKKHTNVDSIYPNHYLIYKVKYIYTVDKMFCGPYTPL